MLLAGLPTSQHSVMINNLSAIMAAYYDYYRATPHLYSCTCLSSFSATQTIDWVPRLAPALLSLLTFRNCSVASTLTCRTRVGTQPDSRKRSGGKGGWGSAAVGYVL